MTELLNLTQSLTTELKAKKRHTSYSQISEFKTCSEKYYLKYIKQIPYLEEKQPALLLGELCHCTLELILKNKVLGIDISNDEAFNICLGSWCSSLGLDVDLESLGLHSKRLGNLITKASPRYQGKDKIRNKDGSTPKSLEEYPPQAWNAAIRPLKTQISTWDRIGAEQVPEVFLKNSLSYLIGRAYSYTSSFVYPENYKTKGVEYGLSIQNLKGEYYQPVPFPGRDKNDILIKVLIDWVLEYDGESILLDHKTSKNSYTLIDIFHSAQLHLYRYAYQIATGERVRKIGIHHLPTGKISIVPVDERVHEEIINSFIKIQEEIDKKSFKKCLPSDYQSPCIKRNYKTQEVESHCPYLERCWPQYYERLDVV